MNTQHPKSEPDEMYIIIIIYRPWVRVPRSPKVRDGRFMNSVIRLVVQAGDVGSN